eukprot:scaffold36145_cov69-Phaeocystis_antarctica.AAC.6
MAAEPRIASSPGAKISSITISANSVSMASVRASSALVASVTPQPWPKKPVNARRSSRRFVCPSSAISTRRRCRLPWYRLGRVLCTRLNGDLHLLDRRLSARRDLKHDLGARGSCWDHVDGEVKRGARPVAPPRRLDLDLRA